MISPAMAQSAGHAASGAWGSALSAASREAVVTFDAVGKRFGGSVVLQDIALAVPQGQILGIIGPSGSGKTTTVRMMLGVYRPTSGTVRVFGRDPARLRRQDRARMGYMPQGFVLYPALTVEENLRFAASLNGVPWWMARRRARALLEYVDLTPARGQRAEQISGGMQRRLSLAATLMHDPAFLILDEPTAGIDPILRASIWEGLREARDEGKTLVITTQYVTEAEYCDTVILIDRGRIIARGTPQELRREATGGDLVDIRFTRPPAEIERWLQALPFVRRVEALGHLGELRVTMDGLSHLPELAAYCQREDGGADITPYAPSFDDVFVRLVSRARAGEENALVRKDPLASDFVDTGR